MTQELQQAEQVLNDSTAALVALERQQETELATFKAKQKETMARYRKAVTSASGKLATLQRAASKAAARAKAEAPAQEPKPPTEEI